MRRVLLTLLFALGVFVGAASAQATQGRPPTVEFELSVGNTMYDVAEGQPFSVVTPKGERVELLLRRKAVLQFADHGVSFNYDPALKVSTAKEVGVVTISVESTASPLAMILIYSIALTPDEAVTSLMQGFRDEFRSRGAEFLEGSGKTVRRPFRGVTREGQALDFLLAGERTRLEVYAFQKGTSVIAVVLQHLASDAELAKKHFGILTDSFQ
jgi:hypothetical protein